MARRTFLRPGSVGRAWARCVGTQNTVSLGKRTGATRDAGCPGDTRRRQVYHSLGETLSSTSKRRRSTQDVLTNKHFTNTPINFTELTALLRKRTSRNDRQIESGLLALPTDCLMRVVCCLRHDELQPLLGTCRLLRQAATAAVAVYFNFTTPEPELGHDMAQRGLLTLRSPPAHYFAAALRIARKNSKAGARPAYRSRLEQHRIRLVPDSFERGRQEDKLTAMPPPPPLRHKSKGTAARCEYLEATRLRVREDGVVYREARVDVDDRTPVDHEEKSNRALFFNVDDVSLCSENTKSLLPEQIGEKNDCV